MPPRPLPRAALADLRLRIADLERGRAAARPTLPFGLRAIDAALPGGGLALGALHEIGGGGDGALDGAAAALFATGVAARARGPVLWIARELNVFAPGLSRAGLRPGRVVYVAAPDDAALLSCFEEGLRHGGVGAVIAELPRLPMTASRRLQLAAEASGSLALALRRWRRSADAADFGQPTAALTRWRVSSLPSAPLPVPGIGRARWLVELMRCRGGGSGDFVVEACDGTGRLRLPADLATDRARRTPGANAPPADVPLVMVGHLGRRRAIIAADALALRAGARIGMAVAQATALIPGLVTRAADPLADAAALERLALWAIRRYAPIATADPPDGIVIDTTGADHLAGGEQALLEDLVERCAAASITARAAVADTRGAAHAAARCLAAPVLVVAPGAARELLPPLPVAALRLSPEIVAGCQALGLARIGDLAGQPRAPLALRFGPEIGRRLDQAFGRLAEPITPLRAAELLEVSHAFAEPISAAETIARYLARLVDAVVAELDARGLGARRLDLVFARVDMSAQAVRVGTSRPTRDPARLTRLLGERIETVDPGFGIERMTLSAPLTEPMAPRQTASSLIAAETPDISELIDALSNRIGAHLLHRFAPRASDVPERSVARVDPLAPDTDADWSEPWPRPAWLLRRPEPIETIALLPDNPPETFTWRGVRRRVRRADGPERIFGEWWSRDAELAAVRDYFQVEDASGARFWIYRAGDGEDPETGSHRWFLHGIFG